MWEKSGFSAPCAACISEFTLCIAPCAGACFLTFDPTFTACESCVTDSRCVLELSECSGGECVSLILANSRAPPPPPPRRAIALTPLHLQAETVEELRSVVASAASSGGAALIELPSLARLRLGGEPIACEGAIQLEIFSSCTGAGGGTVLDGEGLSAIITAAAGCSITLRNVSFVNAAGGAVVANQATTIRVVNASFVNCTGMSGGAISAESTGGVWVEASSFERCSAAYEGGAVRVKSGPASVLSSTFSDCTAGQYGGAVFIDDGGPLQVDGSSFARCRAAVEGGGLYVEGRDGSQSKVADLTRSSFTECTSMKRGSAALFQSVKVSVRDSTFEHCRSFATMDEGGALSFDRCVSASIEDCAFDSCTATGAFGGAVSAYSHSDGSRMLSVVRSTCRRLPLATSVVSDAPPKNLAATRPTTRAATPRGPSFRTTRSGSRPLALSTARQGSTARLISSAPITSMARFLTCLLPRGLKWGACVLPTCA